jgi:hypothetical protein
MNSNQPDMPAIAVTDAAAIPTITASHACAAGQRAKNPMQPNRLLIDLHNGGASQIGDLVSSTMKENDHEREAKPLG